MWLDYESVEDEPEWPGELPGHVEEWNQLWDQFTSDRTRLDDLLLKRRWIPEAA